MASDPTTERAQIIEQNDKNVSLKKAASQFFEESVRAKYSYLFDWLGRPIIQYPQDIMALQQIVWENRPDLIIETGIAHGGSLILSSTLLTLLDVADGIDPRLSNRKVLGIDIEIREHNLSAIETHPFSFKVEMIEGSSVDPKIFDKAARIAHGFERVMVILDSNHTHDHVLQELDLYASLVTDGQYCVVFDTVIENLPDELYVDRPWKRGDNAMTAVREFTRRNAAFEVDLQIDKRLQLSVAPQGYLRKQTSHKR